MRKIWGKLAHFLNPDCHSAKGCRIKILLPTIIMLLVVSLLALLVIFQFTARQNRQAQDDSRNLVRAVLQERQFSLENLLHDYGVWDDAHDHVVVRFDREWIAANIWEYFRDGHDAAFLAVLGPGDEPLALFAEAGQDADSFWEDARVRSLSLSAQIRGRPVHVPESVSVFHHAKGISYILGAAPIQPRKPDPGAGRGMLVVARAITPQAISEIGHLYALEGLKFASSVSPRPDIVSLKLSSGPEGRQYLQWRPHRPGSETLLILLPGLIILVFLFFAMALRMLTVWTETLGVARGRENELNAIFSAAADAILIVDVGGFVRRANASASLLFGRDFQDGDGNVPVDEVIRVPVGRGGVGSLWSFLRMAADRSAVTGIEATGLRGGEDFPVEISAGLARLEGGDGMVLMVRDITQRKRAEAEIIEGRRLAEAASRAKSAFLANMSHEFRTPLNAMIGFSDIIRQQMFGPVGAEKYRDYAVDIHSSAGHLLHIIQNILEMSELESGQVSLREDMFVPRHLADEVVEALSGMAEARKVSVSVAGEGPPMLVADKGKASSILFNLVDNAIRYTRDGRGVRVRIEEGADALSFFIEDGGMGLDDQTREYLFEPFFRGAFSYSQSRGAGLGLAICRKYADLMGGKVSLEWTSPEGSCFAFRLPAGHVPAFFPPPPVSG